MFQQSVGRVDSKRGRRLAGVGLTLATAAVIVATASVGRTGSSSVDVVEATSTARLAPNVADFGTPPAATTAGARGVRYSVALNVQDFGTPPWWPKPTPRRHLNPQDFGAPNNGTP